MPVFFSKGQDKASIVSEMLLPRWEQHCLNNWLTEKGHAQSNRETRIKAFLDGCAYLLLRDNPEDTLSTYKEIARGRSEIPVSSCPDTISDMYYADGYSLNDGDRGPRVAFEQMLKKLDNHASKYGVKEKPRKTSGSSARSRRIEAIRDAYPGSVFHFSRVDTDNQFVHDGRTYQIDQSVAAYSAKQTKEGLLYDMDQVMIVSTDCEMAFFDQDAFPIDDMLVHKIMDDPSEKERHYAKGKRESNRTSGT